MTISCSYNGSTVGGPWQFIPASDSDRFSQSCPVASLAVTDVTPSLTFYLYVTPTAPYAIFHSKVTWTDSYGDTQTVDSSTGLVQSQFAVACSDHFFIQTAVLTFDFTIPDGRILRDAASNVVLRHPSSNTILRNE